MNNHGITTDNLLRTLPDVLKNDQTMRAIATGIAEELALRPSEIANLKIYSRIDELPEELLDILAYDFKVDWWDYDYSLEEKRKTLKDSWKVHRKLATPGAVEQAISAIYPDTKVIEWFEYGGKKHRFKLLIDATYESINPAKHQKVLSKVAYYKRESSRLESVEYVAIPSGYCRKYVAVAAAGVRMEITVGVKMYGLG